jgi:hypothetical protein
LFWFPVFARCFLLSRLCAVYFVVSSLYVVFCFLFFVRCSFVSGWRISFNLVQIQSISTLVSSTLQIRRHGYSGHFNIIIFVGLCNLSFYAINTDTASLFAWFIPFVFSDFKYVLHWCILIIWMNIVCFE